MSKDYDLPTSLNDEITELALKVTNLRERESGNFDLISDLSSTNWSASVYSNEELTGRQQTNAMLPALDLTNLPSDRSDYGLNDDTVVGDVRNHHNSRSLMLSP